MPGLHLSWYTLTHTCNRGFNSSGILVYFSLSVTFRSNSFILLVLLIKVTPRVTCLGLVTRCRHMLGYHLFFNQYHHCNVATEEACYRTSTSTSKCYRFRIVTNALLKEYTHYRIHQLDICSIRSRTSVPSSSRISRGAVEIVATDFRSNYNLH